MSNPLVTLAMPSYQHEAYVRDALRSAFVQSYSPLEILISDDGSTDRTFAIIEEEAARYRGPHKLVVRRNEKNIGPAPHGNLMMDIAQGEFIVVAATDDVSHPDRVKKMVEVWRDKKVSLVTCNAIVIDGSGTSAQRYFIGPERSRDVSLEALARDGSIVTCFGAGMGWDRALYSRFGKLPLSLSTADILLPFRAGLLGGNHFLDEPLLKFRIHRTSSGLSQQLEGASPIRQAEIWEEIGFTHASHTVVMLEELSRFISENGSTERLGQVAGLLYGSLHRFTKQWAEARARLQTVRAAA